jgi:hypothetical protein
VTDDQILRDDLRLQYAPLLRWDKLCPDKASRIFINFVHHVKCVFNASGKVSGWQFNALKYVGAVPPKEYRYIFNASVLDSEWDVDTQSIISDLVFVTKFPLIKLACFCDQLDAWVSDSPSVSLWHSVFKLVSDTHELSADFSAALEKKFMVSLLDSLIECRISAGLYFNPETKRVRLIADQSYQMFVDWESLHLIILCHTTGHEICRLDLMKDFVKDIVTNLWPLKNKYISKTKRDAPVETLIYQEPL